MGRHRLDSPDAGRRVSAPVSLPVGSAQGRFDSDRVSDPESPLDGLRRRFNGRYPIDPFGLDPQLCDASAPIVDEPTALALAVRREAGRRLRVVGTTGVPFVGAVMRRFGAVNGSPEDLGACLRAGHLAVVPLAQTWLRSGAGTPPLRLVQAMMGSTVLPVAVVPGGPFGTAIAPWRVVIGEHIALDSSYATGDPLGAAELAEAARAAVDALLTGRVPHNKSRGTAGLAAG
jgi:hypothetical protein